MKKRKTSSAESTPLLELPKGGGKPPSVGGQLQINECTGALSLSFPIRATLCRDFTPTLALNYTSTVGNGPFGLGVELNLPSITIATQKGIPRYQGHDIFLLTGADYLVVQDPAPSTQTIEEIEYVITRYQPAIETEFLLIESWQSTETSDQKNHFWRVINRDHIVSIFGFTEQARIFDPENQEHIFQWLLEETYDAKGQHHLYFYKSENTESVPDVSYEKTRSQTANKYIERIWYGNITPTQQSLLWTHDPSITTPKAWHFEIIFDYGEYEIPEIKSQVSLNPWLCRKDSFSDYSAGFEIRTHRLCQHVLMFHRFETEFNGDPILVYVTKYTYQNVECLLSQLESIQSLAYTYESGSYTYQELPPFLLQYQVFKPTDSKFTVLSTEEKVSLKGMNEPPYYHLVDLFGAGLPGVLYADGQTTNYQAPILNGQNITYPQPTNLKNFPILRQIAAETTSLMDITADGKMDLVLSGSLHGYFQAQPDQAWKNFSPFSEYPLEIQTEQIQWIDVSGIGLSDLLLLNNGKIRVYPAKRGEGWGPALYPEASVPDDFPPALTSSPTELITFAEMSGSGLSAVVRIRSGEVTYWPNLGYGQFGKGVVMEKAPIFDNLFDIDRLFLADIDGSGYAALIYASSDKITVYLNQTGNQFSDPITIPLDNQQHFDDLDHITFTDLYGNGAAGLLYCLAHRENGPQYFYYDFCQNQKPYLLRRFDNQQGASTTVEYTSSVQCYLQDQAKELFWVTTLPFPVHVVTKMTVHDAFSDSFYSSCYAYHHGYYDGIEREFRGFGYVECRDTELFPKLNDAPPSLTKTWYHLGISDPALFEQYKNEYYSKDSQAALLPNSPINYSGATPTTELTRQAYRALKGQVLRTEIYGLDDSTDSTNPYSVNEYNYAVTLLQNIDTHPYAIWTLHSQEALQYHYERDPKDPQISQQYTLHVDEYGTVLVHANVIYPRRSEGEEIFPQQQLLRIDCQVNAVYNQADDPEQYLLGILTESKYFHISGIPLPESSLFSFKTLRSNIDAFLIALTPQHPSSENATLFNWERYYYAEVVGEETNILPFGTVNLPVLSSHQASASFILSKIAPFFEKIDIDLPTKLQAGYYANQEVSTPEDYWWGYSNRDTYGGLSQYYLLKTTIDPDEQITRYDYEPYQLLLQRVTDPLNNQITITKFNYQLLQGQALQDINDHISEIKTDAFGRVVYTSYYGKEQGKSVGFWPIAQAPNIVPENLSELVKDPDKFLGGMASYFYYNDDAWITQKQPSSIVQLMAEEYPKAASPYEEAPAIQISITYADGLGRNLQTSILAEPGDAFTYDPESKTVGPLENMTVRWLTSNAILYNYKGDLIKVYEPYYVNLPDYIDNTTLKTFGVTSTLFYDAVGRVIQEQTPRGFLINYIFGVWETKTFDENDSILEAPYYLANNATSGTKEPPFYDPIISLAEQAALTYSAKYFANTPHVSILDNRGKVIIQREMNVYPDPLHPDQTITETLETYSEYDLLGRLISISDPRLSEKHLTNALYYYSNFKGPALYTIHADAGSHWALLNVFGQPIFECNSKMVMIDTAYDALKRPLSVMVTDHSTPENSGKLAQMVQYFIYGDDDPTLPNPKENNLRGQLYQWYDEAGLLTTASYSLGAQPLIVTRQFRKDYESEVNWPVIRENRVALLQTESYTQSANYDALNRVLEDIDSDGNTLLSSYYVSGRLSQLNFLASGTLEPKLSVSILSYNAKNQREAFLLGNGVTTSFLYDTITDRLRNTISTKNQEILQSLTYQYDPVGNVVQKENDFIPKESVEESPLSNYTYDALYRLIQATGCESKKPELKTSKASLIELQTYLESYLYDRSGNLTSQSHTANASTNTALFIVSNHSNRAVSSLVNGPGHQPPLPEEVDQYFDSCGNLQNPNVSTILSWDYRSQLQKTVLIHEDLTEETEYYVYDGNGQRLRKVSLTSTPDQVITAKETLYVGHLEIRRTLESTHHEMHLAEEDHTLRIMDELHCIATYSSQASTIYHLYDHLGSSTVDTDENGQLISQIEYYPYGGTAIYTGTPAAEAMKHYWYSGKEQDKMTGFYYYGARYYSSNLYRWLNPDPLGSVDGLNLYAFVGGNPITYTDPSGYAKHKPTTRKSPQKQNRSARRSKKNRKMTKVPRIPPAPTTLVRKSFSAAAIRSAHLGFELKYHRAPDPGTEDFAAPHRHSNQSQKSLIEAVMITGSLSMADFETGVIDHYLAASQHKRTLLQALPTTHAGDAAKVTELVGIYSSGETLLSTAFHAFKGTKNLQTGQALLDAMNNFPANIPDYGPHSKWNTRVSAAAHLNVDDDGYESDSSRSVIKMVLNPKIRPHMGRGGVIATDRSGKKVMTTSGRLVPISKLKYADPALIADLTAGTIAAKRGKVSADCYNALDSNTDF